MFEGSEGSERAVAGRYEGRQTRQVLANFFWHFFNLLKLPDRDVALAKIYDLTLHFAESCTVRRWGSECRRPVPMGARVQHRRGRYRIGGDRRRGWPAPRS